MEESFDKQAWLRALEEAREQAADYYLNQFDWRGVRIPEGFEGPRHYSPDQRWRVRARLDRQAPGSGMRVHRTILPRVVFQIENLINLDQVPSKVKVVALPVKWKTESAPARVIALVD